MDRSSKTFDVDKASILLPESVRKIISHLKSDGFEACVVGGCVRDSLSKRDVNDWDIATSATPEEMKLTLAHMRLVPSGEKYGTITAICDGVPYELTTFRKDGTYSDGRRPDEVAFTRNLREDLQRRDFTINAMAYDDTIGIIDPFGGLNDLEHGKIVCVGSPIERFNEDALRIMRAVRFAVELSFDLPKETVNAIWECGHNLNNISQERKTAELLKMLQGLSTLDKNKVNLKNTRSMVEYIIKRVIPEFIELSEITHNNIHHYTDVFNHTIDMLFAATTDDIELLLTVLFHDIGKMRARQFNEKRLSYNYHGHEKHSAEMTREILTRLRLDNKTINNVVLLVENHDYHITALRSCAKKLLALLSNELCVKLVYFQLLDKAAHRWNSFKELNERTKEIEALLPLINDIIVSGEATELSALAINGNDLLELGYQQGEKIGEILRSCLEYVLENPQRNVREDLLAFVREMGRQE